MNIHEYQAKELLGKYGIPVPAGGVATSVEEAEKVAVDLGGPAWVVKAQVHAGGRGRAGGVKVVESTEGVKKAAAELLGTVLVTEQTGPRGLEVKRVYVEQRREVVQEIYMAMLVDRSAGRVAVLASAEGGEDVEEAMRGAPGQAHKLIIDPVTGVTAEAAARLAADLGLKGKPAEAVGGLVPRLYEAFIETDASLIEINPLGITAAGEVMALDAKMILDDNALYRHPELAALRDEDAVDPEQMEANRYQLNYVKMDGDIGCIVTGAGLALATLDLIIECGGSPGNFMDVRPVATREQVATGVKLLFNNPDIKAILVVAMGGGILRCDSIAEGVALAWRERPRDIPLVMRAAGTNKELGIAALRNQNIPVNFADDLQDAAEKVVEAARTGAAG